MACGQQKVKGGHGSNIASSSASCSASSNASSKAQQVLKKNCEIGVGFSFAALSVFRLRRAEAASALWIPHWHWEPFESQGTRAAKGWTSTRTSDSETSWELGRGSEGSFLLSLVTDIMAGGAVWRASQRL